MRRIPDAVIRSAAAVLERGKVFLGHEYKDRLGNSCYIQGYMLKYITIFKER